MTQYDEDYYIRGKETGKSLYTSYSWMPELTLPMACTIANHLGIRYADTVLDFGCARGYLVKALRMMGYNAFGFDLSEWAIENCDDEVEQFVSCKAALAMAQGYDWVIAKDVLEHVQYVADDIPALMKMANKGVFAVVPLSKVDGHPYDVPEYELDVTHVHRLSLKTWAGMFMRPGWVVEARYRLRGVKDNYAEFPTGNGFLTARRLT